MKNSDWIKNIIYILLISTFCLIGTILLKNHEIQAQRTFNSNPAYLTFIIIFFGGIGVILGLDNINVLLKKKDKLKFNKSKLLLVGIPSFLVSMTYIWIYLGLFALLPSITTYLLKNNYVIIF